VAKSEKVQFVEEGMSYYRVGNLRSLSTSTSDKTCESLLLSLSLCTQYLLALENSKRTQNACVNMLQIWMPFLYPEKAEFICKLNSLASQLGGRLAVPEASWKYYLIKMIFGWTVAKKVMTACRRAKLKAVRGFDRLMYSTMYKARRLS
jgi:hypothetical protein